MANQLSESSDIMLTGLYNEVWEKGKLPQIWKEVVVPIHKPGNYRPIALTSNICKIMERMIH